VPDNQRYIDTLNELLKGELMAMNIYKETDDIQGDEQVTAMLAEFARDHQEHARLLTNRIHELGGTPIETAGLPGAMADITAKVNALMGPSHLLEQIYGGEDKGVHAYEDRIDELDPKSQELVRRIMDTDHDHLRRFKERMEAEKSRH
jgi:bacterioferritin